MKGTMPLPGLNKNSENKSGKYVAPGLRNRNKSRNTTPSIKVLKVREFGGEFITIRLVGDSYDDCYKEAISYCNKNKKTFIHPFDDEKVIAGQGSLAYEIFKELNDTIDYLFIPIGGGGLISGFISVF